MVSRQPGTIRPPAVLRSNGTLVVYAACSGFAIVSDLRPEQPGAPNPGAATNGDAPMLSWLVEVLRHPEMTLCLTLALGIGKIRLGGFTLGAVVGVLIAGVIIGQIGVKVSGDLKTGFFSFSCSRSATGRGRSSSAGFARAAFLRSPSPSSGGYAFAKALGFDAGTAAGLLARALTESATVCTGTDAIKRLGLDAAAQYQMVANMAVGFAVTFFLGVIRAVTVLSPIGPKLLGVDKKARMPSSITSAAQTLAGSPSAIENLPSAVLAVLAAVAIAYLLAPYLGRTVRVIRGAAAS